MNLDDTTDPKPLENGGPETAAADAGSGPGARADGHPVRPLLIYDGRCGFCRFWVESWRSVVEGRVDFAPSQEVASQYPGIRQERFGESVQLVLPDGTVFSGAEAVFRALAYTPRKHHSLWMYQHVPGFSAATESIYRVVASHRPFFSMLTGLLWGKQAQPSSYALSRWLLLRLLAVVYFVAFLSLCTQVTGLVGGHGILPAESSLNNVSAAFGVDRYYLFPTLAWFNSSDTFLRFLTEGGALLSLLVVLDIFTAPLLVILWVFYLSLVTVGGDFMSFQWDILLLEAGFLAIFFAPWRLVGPPWKMTLVSEPRPSRTLLWLFRWLLFRLLFLSGAVKLLSGDPTWRNLTALDYHYWTQPLPTPIAWYAAQLPAWFQRLSVVGVFTFEIAVPFLIFAPRRLRFLGAGLAIFFQLLIGLTGNYCFFNILTVALCIPLFEDALLARWFPSWFVERLTRGARPAAQTGRIRQIVTAVLAVVILFATSARMAQSFGFGHDLPTPSEKVLNWLAPFYVANNYGLFAVMTTSRLEIQVEGSQDGENWLPYEFKYKPGGLTRVPRWAEPMQPRLDWQMWFAALGTYQQNPWFVNFMVRLAQGSREVLALLQENPFPDAPPRYVRAELFDYHFTNLAERRATGNWWRREPRGLYFPVVSLRDR